MAAACPFTLVDTITKSSVTWFLPNLVYRLQVHVLDYVLKLQNAILHKDVSCHKQESSLGD